MLAAQRVNFVYTFLRMMRDIITYKISSWYPMHIFLGVVKLLVIMVAVSYNTNHMCLS